MMLHQSPPVIKIGSRPISKISPYIYGVNYPDTGFADWLKEWELHHLGFSLAREGGNRFTAYNWETNASNAGNDYFFENDDYLGTSNQPGWTVSQFLQHVQVTGAAALLTVPTLGFVSADKDSNRDGGKDVNHTPNYLQVRFLKSLATKPNNSLSYVPDLTDGRVYQDEFVHWVEHVASSKSPVWFSLDNEPDLWSTTHARICLTAPGYDDIIKNNRAYAMAIKSVAPKALVFGPVNYGWNGIQTFQGAKDAGGRVFIDTYLAAMKGAGVMLGKRLLDVYDFHWYPEAMGDGIRICYSSQPDKPGTEEARIQAPRSLWDPSYVEKSWIAGSLGNKPIRLLPYMNGKIKEFYPDTKLSVSEYDFGGRRSISGALAQADALGIFGREGLFAACHWGLTHEDYAATAGFLAFTNFDRQGSHFGDLALPVSGQTPAENSVYAALDSLDRSKLTIVTINKTASSQTLSLDLGTFPVKGVFGYQVDSRHYGLPAITVPNFDKGVIYLGTPPRSITTLAVELNVK